MTQENQSASDREIGWQARSINAEFERTGVKFTAATNADTLAAFGRPVDFNADGQPSTEYDGETLPLGDALTRWAYDNRQHCDGRTLPRTGVGAGRPGIASKADFDLAGKLAYIKTHGGEAWEKLPLKNADGHEVTTKQDWSRLSAAEKVRRLKANPAAYDALPNATTGQPRGGFINHAALEKLKQTRPGGR